MGYSWLIVILIVAIYFVAKPPAHQTPPARKVLPRPTQVQDCGYAGTGGWYDVQGQGVKNDYCRTVGDNPKWVACALAGPLNSGNQLVPAGPNLGARAELAPGDVCYRK